MRRSRPETLAAMAASLALALAAGCSLLIDPFLGAPCSSPTYCPDGYRCLLSECTPEEPNRCGDFVVEGDEMCDDGNAIDGDGCESDCRPEACPGGGFVGDDDHCTGCGQSCLGGACNAGQCAPELLASDLQMVVDMELDDSHLYYATDNQSRGGGFDPSVLGLYRLPLGGSANPTKLAAVDRIDGLALSADSIYYNYDASNQSNSAVMRLSKPSGTPVTVVNPVPYPSHLTLAETTLLLVSGQLSENLVAVSTTTGDTTTIADVSDVNFIEEILVVGSTVYLGASGTGNRVCGVFLGGGTPTCLGSSDGVPPTKEIAFDGTDLYILSASSAEKGLYTCDLALTECALVPGFEDALGSGLVLDDDWVFTMSGDGVFRRPRAGGRAVLLLPLASSGPRAEPFSGFVERPLLADDEYLYVLTLDRANDTGYDLWRLPK